MSKKEKFFEMLKSYGIESYWCSPGFDENDELPMEGTLVLPTEDKEPICACVRMYYADPDDEALFTQQVFNVMGVKSNKIEGSMFVRGLERRGVV